MRTTAVDLACHDPYADSSSSYPSRLTWCITWNVEGIFGAIRGSPEANPFSDAEVVFLQETFVKEITDPLRDLAHSYTWWISPAVEGNARRLEKGIIILTKPHLSARLLSRSTSHLLISTARFYAASFYFPPNYPTEDTLTEIVTVLSSVPQDLPTIITGDFNHRVDLGNRGKDLMDGLNLIGVTLINDPGTPTYMCHNGQSTIDLVMKTHYPPAQVRDIAVLPTLTRKHQRVKFSVETNKTSRNPVQPRAKLKRTIDLDLVTQNLVRYPPPQQSSLLEASTSQLTTIIHSSTPKVTPRKDYHKPWFDRACARLKKTVLSLRGRPDQLQQYNALHRNYKALLKEKKEEHEEQNLTKKINDSESAPWMLFRKKHTHHPSPIDPEAWEEHFSQLLNPTASPPAIPEIEDLVPRQEREDLEWYNVTFSNAEITHVVTRKAKRKAPGPDLICNEHLQTSLPLLLPLLAHVLNLCLTQMRIPQTWRNGILKTIYKGKGDRGNPNQYRGIALLSVVFKTLTSLINNRLQPTLTNLPPEQFGFQRGKSTREPVAALVTTISDHLAKKGGHLYVLLVDFSKAFDVISRTILIRKLKERFQVKGRILGLIASILRENYLTVSDSFTETDPILQSRGVPQGDSLSPSLFIMYISDLSEKIRDETEADHHFFADDLEAHSPDRTEIQSTLDLLDGWTQENGLDLNPGKTKVIKFRNGGHKCQDDLFWFRNSEIEMVSSYEYLGITLQTTLTFTEHIRKLKRRAAVEISSLSKLHLVSLDCALKIFHMKIMPSITYCLDIISPRLTLPQLLDLDKIKSAFLKKTLGLHISASATLAHELAGCLPLCLDLKHKNFQFDPRVWEGYLEQREERGINFCIDYGTGPAFKFGEWKRAHQKNRHFYTRATSHGFHHRLCSFQNCFSPDLETCTCVLCGRNAGLHHIEECPARGEDTLPEFARFLETL